MKNLSCLFISMIFCLLQTYIPVLGDNGYVNNKYPLTPKSYIELPLGSIQAEGWLLEMLKSQKEGATGQMDKLYAHVMGDRNGWLGGDGDQWERGPYWIDGLLPLAYILNDNQLKAKVQPWIEWALNSQQESGYFGPATNYGYEAGLQRDNCEDWWPRMVVLKILQQYYSATNDARVIPFMTNYFRYQLKTLPEKPLRHWTYWAEYRACDNMQAVYWLYNITGEPFLLELGELLHKQSHDFYGMFAERNDLAKNTLFHFHCVNLAQGLKEPIIYYQQKADQKYIDAVKKGLSDLKKHHGQPQGMYGGDEALHGCEPTQGAELCSAVELMYSLEKMVEITGDISFADQLEKIAFNALPTQISDDFMTKQYYQQANQVMITRTTKNFAQEHDGTDITFGLLTGYPCCASNMHQGWPKFTQNLWYATPDNGLAAMVYSPSSVTAKVGNNGNFVRIKEATSYPMEDVIYLDISFPEKKVKTVAFPLHLRIPGWAKQAKVKINNEQELNYTGEPKIILNRTWKNGDKITVSFQPELKVERWKEGAVSIERGPLTFALKMDEQWQKKIFSGEEIKTYGDYYYEVTSSTPWNYGIVNFDFSKINELVSVSVDKEKLKEKYPWNVQNAPLSLKIKAKKIPHWKLYNEMAGPIPYSITYVSTEEEEITLIPYGCTTLRISEFPIVQ